MTDIVGIDLGTTNSLIGVMEAGFPILLADETGSRLTPSAVWFPPDGSEPVTGAAALRRRITDPEGTVVSIKRLIGRRPGEMDYVPDFPVARDGEGRIVTNIGGIRRSPEQVSALILGRLKEIAGQALERPVSRAVITVPAYFNDAQRNATRVAGELAGFQVERILNEPTAAALAFGLDRLDERSRIVVYDLGGGTFDISILELNGGVFQVLSTHGDTRLGGDDIDRLFAAHLAGMAFPGEDPARLPAEIRARLHEAATDAKHRLSSEEAIHLQIPFLRGSESFSCSLTRGDLERCAAPLVDRTRSHCMRALADAGLTTADIDRVVLVGGSTRMPLVRRTAAEIFGRDPDTSRHPDETVALGAVIQAGILSGAVRNVTLLDVTPLSLGIETFGGLMNVIIPRNTTIPARAGEMFTNAVGNQTEMLVRVLQGEREMAKDNWELGRLQLEFPPGPRGSARLGVQFRIDADGILHILARDTKTNTDRELEIRHTAVDVDDTKVEQMIAESVEYAFEDMSERQFTEAKLKAEELLAAVDAALPLAGDALDTAGQTAILEGCREVRSALAAGGLPRLKAANLRLDAATEGLAAAIVDRAMEQAMERRLG